MQTFKNIIKNKNFAVALIAVLILVVSITYLAKTTVNKIQRGDYVAENNTATTTRPADEVYTETIPRAEYCAGSDYLGAKDVDPNKPSCGYYANNFMKVGFFQLNDFANNKGSFDDIFGYCRFGNVVHDTNFKIENNGKNYFPGAKYKWTCELNNLKTKCSVVFDSQNPECADIRSLNDWPTGGEEDPNEPQSSEPSTFCKVGEVVTAPEKPRQGNPDPEWKCATSEIKDLDIVKKEEICKYCGEGKYSSISIVNIFTELYNQSNVEIDKKDEYLEMLKMKPAPKDEIEYVEATINKYVATFNNLMNETDTSSPTKCYDRKIIDGQYLKARELLDAFKAEKFER